MSGAKSLTRVVVFFLGLASVAFHQVKGQELVSPFAEGPVEKASDQHAQEAARKAARAALRLSLIEAGEDMARDFAQERDDALFLEGVLALLHYRTVAAADPKGELPALLDRLAQHSWRQLRGESVEQMLARLQRELEADQSRSVQNARGMGKRFKELGGKAWPLDWRAKSDHWLAFVEAAIRSKRDRDPAAAWRRRIEQDPENGTLYRMGYMATIRCLKPGALDFSLVEPLLQQQLPDPLDRLLWQARVLGTMAVALVPEDNPHRSELRKQFFKELEATKLTAKGLHRHRALSMALRAVLRHGDPELEARPLLRTLARAEDPEVLNFACYWMKLSERERCELMLAKPVKVEVAGAPFGEVVWQLDSRVRLPLWISHEVLADQSKVSFAAAGSWLSVMERLLKGSSYRFFQLSPGLFWIGRPEDRQRAEQALASGLLKSTRQSPPVREVLDESSGLQCSNTPLQDVVALLGERHGISVKAIGSSATALVTMNVKGLPLHALLTLLTKRIDADWGIFDQVVLIGPAKDLRSFEQLADKQLKRKVRLLEAGSPLASILDERTRMEFIQTPLSDVVAYLQDQHRIHIELARDVARSQPVTTELSGIRLDTALCLVTFDLGLDWDTDGKVVFIGSKDSIKALRQNMTKRLQQERAP